MTPLATLKEFKDWLGTGAKSNSVSDPLLNSCLDAASDWVREQVNRDLTQQAYDERYNGNGLPYLSLNQVPVATSTLPAVEEDGSALVVAVGYDLTADVILDPVKGWLNRQPGTTPSFGVSPGIPGRWSLGFQNVRVVYTAGYATIPPSLKSLALYVAARYWKESDRKEFGVLSRSTGSHSVTFLQGLPEIYKETIRRNKRVYYAPR